MQELSKRTQDFALRIVKLFSALPKTIEAQVIGKQLLRSGTSVEAHYREGMRARSKNEFVTKIDVGLQELEETGYWLELLVLSEIVSEKQLKELLQEVKEIKAILITVSKKTKKQIL
ncbi:MAG: four helix bundle protein [Chlamydiae bacterium]|nr:four helix bundle protein [Chlamydiota bacterium]